MRLVSSSSARRTVAAPAVFGCLLLLCALAYAGRTYSIDELAVMATASSLARGEGAQANLLAFAHWDLPPPSGLLRIGPDGNAYSKKTPGMALLAAPLARLGMIAPGLGVQHAALLLSPLLTATSGALLYVLGARMGYRPAVALIGAGLFGVGTMALVYSRTLFTEPLAMAGLMLATLGGHAARSGSHPSLSAGLCGIGLAIAVGGNPIYALIVPLFALYVGVGSPAPRAAAIRLGALGVPVVLAILSLAGLNAARFGSALVSGYHFEAGEGLTTPLWLGAYGLLASPARGLIWYVPLAWPAVLGWNLLRRERAPEAWLALAALIWHVGLFGAWWAWAGGVSWGPRFLLPLMPLLAMCLLPLVERALRPSAWGWLAGLILVAGVSVAVQVIGAASDMNRVEAVLSDLSPRVEGGPPGFEHNWPALNRPGLSAIIIGARLIYEGSHEVAWLRDGPDWVGLGMIGGGLLVAATLTAWLALRRPARAGLISAGVAMMAIAVFGAAVMRLPSDPSGPGGELRQLPAALAEHAPGDVLLTLTPDLTWALLEVTDRPPAWGLPRGAPPDDPQAAALFEGALDGAERVWLLTYDPPPPSWYEDALREGGTLVSEQVADGYRLALYVHR
jgi:hypothetical protein